MGYYRFYVLTNMNSEAVLDRETGLVWERSPSNPDIYTWADAQKHCNAQVTTGNRGGWRLPTIQELASLLDFSVAPPGPLLPIDNPFSNVRPEECYWSATSSIYNPGTEAWFVYFKDGTINYTTIVQKHSAWCVRGGQGVDSQ